MKLVEFFFIVCVLANNVIRRRDAVYVYILGGEGTVMKISTKCNRCDRF